MTRSSIFKAIVATIGALASGPPAHAHHAMDGTTPTTLIQGFLSGLAHPVIGLDHFAFLIALGLLLASQVRVIPLAALFIAGSMAGVLWCVEFGAPQWIEWVVAASVIGVGVFLAFHAKRESMDFGQLLLMALPVAGVFHGLAFGESIVGSEPTVLAGYLAGLGIVQVAIVGVVAAMAGWLLGQGNPRVVRLQAAGAAVTLIGAVQIGLLLLPA